MTQAKRHKALVDRVATAIRYPFRLSEMADGPLAEARAEAVRALDEVAKALQEPTKEMLEVASLIAVFGQNDKARLWRAMAAVSPLVKGAEPPV